MKEATSDGWMRECSECELLATKVEDAAYDLKTYSDSNNRNHLLDLLAKLVLQAEDFRFHLQRSH